MVSPTVAAEDPASSRTTVTADMVFLIPMGFFPGTSKNKCSRRGGSCTRDSGEEQMGRTGVLGKVSGGDTHHLTIPLLQNAQTMSGSGGCSSSATRGALDRSLTWASLSLTWQWVPSNSENERGIASLMMRLAPNGMICSVRRIAVFKSWPEEEDDRCREVECAVGRKRGACAFTSVGWLEVGRWGLITETSVQRGRKRVN